MKVALLPAVTAEQREAAAKADEINRLVWITCRVCGMRSKVSLDNPALLCQPCRVDPIMTEAHVLHLRDALRARLWKAGEAWTAGLSATPEDIHERWAKVEQARHAVAKGEVAQTAFDATWQRARAAGGPFAALLLAWEAYQQEIEACNEGLERCGVSLAEIAAYLDATAQPRAAGEGKPC